MDAATTPGPDVHPLLITGFMLPSLENVHLGHFDLELSRPLTVWEERALPDGVQHLAGRLRVESGTLTPDDLAQQLARLGERAALLQRKAAEKASELEAEAAAVMRGLQGRGA